MPSSETSIIEVINKEFRPARITQALFDFDGTVSLIREGWQEVMIPMMVRELLKTPRHESEAELKKLVTDYVDELTGKQTMYQMLQLVEEIKRRGSEPLTALEYKHRYLELLEEYIAERIRDLDNGAPPEKYLVAGAGKFIKTLRDRGVICYLASGTDQKFVEREAKLLQIRSFFESIWGAEDDYLKFSKKIAMERIIRGSGARGKNLVVFGDGFVEMEVAREYGAAAIGVATDEAAGGIDERKRKRLIEAGADVIIQDFMRASDLDALLMED